MILKDSKFQRCKTRERQRDDDENGEDEDDEDDKDDEENIKTNTADDC